MKMAIVGMRKNHEHIIGREHEQSYELEYLYDMAKRDIQGAIDEYMVDKLPDEVPCYIKEEMQDMKSLEYGDYSLDLGDFTFYAIIKEA